VDGAVTRWTRPTDHAPLHLDQVLDAYDTFGRAAETHALKVIIEA
jgi:hypothetical protein